MSIDSLDWNRFGGLVLELYRQIEGAYKVDVIVGVGKSGLIPAAILAKKLGVDEYHAITVKFYDEGKPPQRLFEEPRISHIEIGSMGGKNVLVVDDFAHTGSTLRKVVNALKERGATDVRSAVVALRKDAKLMPNYYAMKFTGCVIFPWDTKVE